MKVLVVDDDDLIRDLFRDALEEVGEVEVVTERSGFRAMSRVHEEPYDLVFCDIMMPGFNGWQTIEQITEIRPDLRIIVITGYGTKDIVDQALDKGARDCMKKPFDIAEIREAVENIRQELAAGDA